MQMNMNKKQTGNILSPTPETLARRHRRETGLGAVAFETANPPEREKPSIWDMVSDVFAQAGQVTKIDGKWYRWTPQTNEVESYLNDVGFRVYKPRAEPLTYWGYYGHDTTGGINGAGWDRRFALADPETAKLYHGRTFTHEEVFETRAHMSKDQVLKPVPLTPEEILQLELP